MAGFVWTRFDWVGLGWTSRTSRTKSDDVRLIDRLKAGTSGADFDSVFISLNFWCDCFVYRFIFIREDCREGGGTFTVLP